MICISSHLAELNICCPWKRSKQRMQIGVWLGVGCQGVCQLWKSLRLQLEDLQREAHRRNGQNWRVALGHTPRPSQAGRLGRLGPPHFFKVLKKKKKEKQTVILQIFGAVLFSVISMVNIGYNPTVRAVWLNTSPRRRPRAVRPEGGVDKEHSWDVQGRELNSFHWSS